MTNQSSDGVGRVRGPRSSANDSVAGTGHARVIAFESDRDCCAHQIYVMNADGSGVVLLTSRPDYAGKPSWSPDGSKIAFMHWDGGYQIYVMNADGSGLVRLTTGQFLE